MVVPQKEESDNFDDDDDDDNNANYEKTPIKQIRNKKRKESVTI